MCYIIYTLNEFKLNLLIDICAWASNEKKHMLDLSDSCHIHVWAEIQSLGEGRWMISLGTDVQLQGDGKWVSPPAHGCLSRWAHLYEPQRCTGRTAFIKGGLNLSKEPEEIQLSISSWFYLFIVLKVLLSLDMQNLVRCFAAYISLQKTALFQWSFL